MSNKHNKVCAPFPVAGKLDPILMDRAVKELYRQEEIKPLISWAWKWYPLFMVRLSEIVEVKK